MQEHEMDAYLGDFADQLDEGQRQVLKVTLEKLDERWPSPDFTDEQLAAGNAATEIAFGDSTADGIAAEYRMARDAERIARLRMVGAILYTDQTTTLSEQGMAERFGVTRMTIRKALGK